MNKHNLIKIILFTLVISFSFFYIAPLVSAQTTGVSDEVTDIIKNSQPKLQIDIPGLKFTDPQKASDYVKEQGETTYISIPYLGEYIAAIYKYGVVVTTILAIVIIINAGLKWVLSAGSSDKISEAQKQIAGAIIGIVIALSSYVLLYTINPNLVNFKNLTIKFVKEVPIENALTELMGGDDANTNTPIPFGDGTPGKYREDMFSVCGDRNGFSLPTYEQRLEKLTTIIKKWKEVGVDQGGAKYIRGGSWTCSWFNINPSWAIAFMGTLLDKMSPGSLSMKGQCLDLATQAVPLGYRERIKLVTENTANRAIATTCSAQPNGEWYLDYKNNFVAKAKNNGLLCGDCASTMRSMLFSCFNKSGTAERNNRFSYYRPSTNTKTCTSRGKVDTNRYVFNPTHKPTASEVIAQIPKMRPGDIIAWQRGSVGHIMMFTGNGPLPYEILEMGGGGPDDLNGGGSGSYLASKNMGIPWTSAGMRAHKSASTYMNSFVDGNKCVFIFRPIVN
jgi:hypothetical protein